MKRLHVSTLSWLVSTQYIGVIRHLQLSTKIKNSSAWTQAYIGEKCNSFNHYGQAFQALDEPNGCKTITSYAWRTTMYFIDRKLKLRTDQLNVPSATGPRRQEPLLSVPDSQIPRSRICASASFLEIFQACQNDTSEIECLINDNYRTHRKPSREKLLVWRIISSLRYPWKVTNRKKNWCKIDTVYQDIQTTYWRLWSGHYTNLKRWMLAYALESLL